ncbi:hypothetical protein M514_27690 [Trichuris suis]|uniref:Uncharacterized protein n=1 Tax=Trichuris suis TaxID=68888 RepID=A0A085MSE2_9BILA|nr:hypothetical protein M514_27690 [Trichuris suis]
MCLSTKLPGRKFYGLNNDDRLDVTHCYKLSTEVMLSRQTLVTKSVQEGQSTIALNLNGEADRLREDAIEVVEKLQFATFSDNGDDVIHGNIVGQRFKECVAGVLYQYTSEEVFDTVADEDVTRSQCNVLNVNEELL